MIMTSLHRGHIPGNGTRWRRSAQSSTRDVEVACKTRSSTDTNSHHACPGPAYNPKPTTSESFFCGEFRFVQIRAAQLFGQREVRHLEVVSHGLGLRSCADTCRENLEGQFEVAARRQKHESSGKAGTRLDTRTQGQSSHPSEVWSGPTAGVFVPLVLHVIDEDNRFCHGRMPQAKANVKKWRLDVPI